VPGNIDDPYYANSAGYGGLATTTVGAFMGGNPGRIVIVY
jgi:hypothetical protein